MYLQRRALLLLLLLLLLLFLLLLFLLLLLLNLRLSPQECSLTPPPYIILYIPHTQRRGLSSLSLMLWKVIFLIPQSSHPPPPPTKKEERRKGPPPFPLHIVYTVSFLPDPLNVLWECQKFPSAGSETTTKKAKEGGKGGSEEKDCRRPFCHI